MNATDVKKNDNIIQFDHVTFQYNKEEGKPIQVLKDISLEIQAGSFVAVLGHNGCGKSTLAKHMNAILLPSGGTVYVNGVDTRRDEEWLEVRRTVGMVFQNPDNQIVSNVVEEDVAFAPENLGVPTDAPHLLSGGQKQRVAIAGIIAMEPKCVVLDEPTAMLDPIGRQEVLETILKLNREQGTTVVLITHHMDEAALADRLIVMNDGNVIADGVPKIVFQQVDELKRVGLTVPDTIALLYRLRQAGVDVPLDALSVEECAAAIQKAIWPHTTVR